MAKLLNRWNCIGLFEFLFAVVVVFLHSNFVWIIFGNVDDLENGTYIHSCCIVTSLEPAHDVLVFESWLRWLYKFFELLLWVVSFCFIRKLLQPLDPLAHTWTLRMVYRSNRRLSLDTKILFNRTYLQRCIKLYALLSWLRQSTRRWLITSYLGARHPQLLFCR